MLIFSQLWSIVKIEPLMLKIFWRIYIFLLCTFTFHTIILISVKNTLHIPKLIKNLIYIHKFTHNNTVYVEFEPFGIFVNDLGRGSKILRCDSQGVLCPFNLIVGMPSSSFILYSILFYFY